MTETILADSASQAPRSGDPTGEAPRSGDLAQARGGAGERALDCLLAAGFERTEPLEFLLFQSPIHHAIGEDAGIGVEYRPPLTENIVLTAGASALQPAQGFKDIYTGRTQFSLFGSAKFTF